MEFDLVLHVNISDEKEFQILQKKLKDLVDMEIIDYK